MKELSIEEKARAYDGIYKAYTDLINRLEDVKNAIKKQNYGIAMDILCKPYPEFQITTSTELKESEDERIKKMLRDVISQWRTGNQAWCSDVKLIDATLAWLEKQGEHANFRNKIQIGDKVTRNEDGVLVNLSQLNRVAKKDESQCQTFTKKDDYPDSLPKDNWELIREFITKFGRIPKDEDELNILVQYVLKRQKPAWSEEDDVAVKDICDKLNRLSMTYVGNESIVCQEEIKWLKSLRPQNTWKPSEEQITVLHDVAAYIDNSIYPNQKDILVNLYLQLKKLMKE